MIKKNLDASKKILIGFRSNSNEGSVNFMSDAIAEQKIEKKDMIEEAVVWSVDDFHCLKE